MAANEAQLLRQFQASGSRDALRELLVVHQDRVYNACFQVLGRAEDAEDAAQEALLKLAEGARSARDADAFRGWIYRVSFRIALDHWRRREAIRNRELRSAMNRPSAPPLDDRERVALFEAMDGLDDRDRSLLLEHYFEKVPLADLGERRGVSAVAIWKRIDRAREKLKRALLGAGFIAASARAGETLEASVPASSPTTLVGEALIGKILAGGLAVGATKSSVLAISVVAMVLLFVLTAGGFMVFRNRDMKPGEAPQTVVVTSPSSSSPESRDTATPQTPEQTEGAGPEAPGPLRETLKKYREWFNEWRKAAHEPTDPANPRRVLRLQYEGFKRFPEARTQICAEHETFLEFLRNPGDPDLVPGVIQNLLGKNEQSGEGGAYSLPQYYKDFPVELLDGMVALLKSESRQLRTAVLGFLGTIHDVPARYDQLYEELMYDPDPRIQEGAVYARWRQRSLELPDLEKLLTRYQTATDRYVQERVLSAISYSPRPETFNWMLDSLEAAKGGPLAYRMATAATQMSRKLTVDASTTDRLIRNVLVVFEQQTGENQQNSLLWSALYMPPKDSIRVLEGALPKAVTPKLKQAIQSTLEKSADGSATWDDLQNHFWRLMK